MTLCLVDGCERQRSSKGYCVRHYNRYHRYGDPLGGSNEVKTQWGEAGKFFREVVLPFKGYECLIWPFANKGKKAYGKLWYDGKMREVHRYACELVNGDPPTKEHQAAHSCGNGMIGCVNPTHVRWATVQENVDDRKIHAMKRGHK